MLILFNNLYAYTLAKGGKFMDKIVIKKDKNFLQYLCLKDRKIILNTIENGILSEEIIVKDCLSDFDVCYDEEGKINLIYYNSKGEIVFLIQKEEGWIGKALYAYKDKKTYISNFHLFIKNKTLHIFFTISNFNNPREVHLIHQKWAKNWDGNNIAVIRNISFTPFYDLFIDEEENIHLIYITKEKNNSQLYYLNYIKDNWSPKFLISEAEGIFYPTITIDPQKNVHTLWVEEDIIQEIKYRKKTPGSWPKGSWGSIMTLAYSTNIKNCYISLLENTLWCTYLQNESFFATMSSDEGNSWCKPFKIPPSFSEYNFFKLKTSIDKFQSNYLLINDKGDVIPSLQYKLARKNGEKGSYFTFYIKEVQEYLNILIKKLETIKEEKTKLEEELSRKNVELAIKNKNIADLQELLRQTNDEKIKIVLKADNYNTMVNSLIRENENLKKQIKDLQNQIITLNSKLEALQNVSTFQKIKSIFIKSDEN